MMLSPAVALVWMVTTLAAAAMITVALSQRMLTQRRPRRCAACGRLASGGRCRCTDDP
jgi:hypothetical protein